MTESSQLVQYIELFVDSSRSLPQQEGSLEKITSLVKNDVLTIETLVREMDMYLTSTDNIIRGRGMLLLGEVLTRIASKPVDSMTICSLIRFFKERLADWKALRGALVGCLSLMRRKSNAGMVAWIDAKAVAHSYFQNLQVQSLGQHDRKLCFELLECLLKNYPDAVASLGDDLVYGICEAVDGEKDPECLMLTFHIIEDLARLFPDPSGTLASFAGDLFEILGCYFPIHFTHAKDEDVDVKRDDLSRALMLAISSTPLFEPFAIPLLIEKLSSLLPSAKVDSLKYLNECTLKYGAERMKKHYEVIWSSLKDVIFTSVQEPLLSFSAESLNSLSFHENEIATEAKKLLQKVVMQDDGSFLSLIVGDEDINDIFNTLNSYTSYGDIPSKGKKKLHVVGHILYISANASIASCSKVFERFLPLLLDSLRINVTNSSGNQLPNGEPFPSGRLNFGALYLCVELVAASRDLLAGSEGLLTECVLANETWYHVLKTSSYTFSQALHSTFATTSNKDAHDAEIYVAVKGLQILATFPGDSSPISKALFEYILLAFMSILTVDFSNTLIWKLALKALVHIGSCVDINHGSEKALSYMAIVVEKLVSLVSTYDFTMPLKLKLEAVSDIGTSKLTYMLKIVGGLEEAIISNFSEIYVQGNSKSAENIVFLLECYSSKVLPWIHENGGFEEGLRQFTVNIWNQIETCMDVSSVVVDKVLLDATMTVMKLAVQSCTTESQNIIIQKAYNVLSACASFSLKETLSGTIPLHLEGLHVSQQKENSSSRDEWIVALFTSVIIAIRPNAYIPNVRALLHLFIIALLNGCVPAAQALGSMVNKLALKSDAIKVSGDCTLEEAIDIIFNTKFWHSHDNTINIVGNMGLTDLCIGRVSSSLRVNAIDGLAWIGKGLLLRGHEKVKDVTMVFLECLDSNSGKDDPPRVGSLKNGFEKNLHSSVMKNAADAFHILMSDSEACLNRKYHAIMRPLYKQRFFSIMMPILQTIIRKSNPSEYRCMLYRVFAHIIIETPLVVILSDAKKLILMLLDALSMLNGDIQDKDNVYGLLLVLSGILMDKNGREAVTENAHIVIKSLTGLIAYPHKMLVRETAIQCIVAVSELPHAKIYPMRTQVLQAISKALDDPKRAVRQEAVRCRQAWASIASRSLHF